MKRAVLLVGFLISQLLALHATAVEGSKNLPAEPGTQVVAPDYSETLLGDWGGRRASMSASGYDWELAYKLSLHYKNSQPNQRLYGLDNLDIKLNLDGEKLAGLKGTTALLYILSNHGGKPGGFGARGVDNIETPEGGNTIKIYQAWIQQAFFDDQLSVRVGLYDLNSEFYATDASGIFLQPTYGIGDELAGTGQNGPSVFPTASFAIRARYESHGYYLQGVTLDGVPGDPANHQGTHVQFNKGDGALNVIEAGIPLASGNPSGNKFGVGVWRYTTRVADVDPAVTEKQLSHGLYAIAEKVMQTRPGSEEPNVSGFLRGGITDGNTAQVDFSWSTGLVFAAPFGAREQDAWGIAYMRNRNGTRYRAVSADPQITHEDSVEVDYRYQAIPGLVLQPSIQYVIHHNSDPTQDGTWWTSLRLEANF
ncbi:MAG: carbohydrate porin [Gallionella sp.]